MSNKPDCRQHPVKIEKYNGSLADLACDVGDLRYDKLEDFLAILAEKIHSDAHFDKKEGRIKLSTNLQALQQRLQFASMDAGSAWITCKPYME